jgi:hypothetical protein
MKINFFKGPRFDGLKPYTIHDFVSTLQKLVPSVIPCHNILQHGLDSQLKRIYGYLKLKMIYTLLGCAIERDFFCTVQFTNEYSQWSSSVWMYVHSGPFY